VREKTQPRTTAATSAAAEAALKRRISTAAQLLREHGWSVSAPAHAPSPQYNDLGQHVDPAGRETTYRCPVDGKESWYVAAADRFYHRDGSDSRGCLRSMHRGETMWPMPVIHRTERR
jgi:hypothetical protein